MESKSFNFRDGKESFSTVEKKGRCMDQCATFNDKYICCRVHVLRSIHNCPFECSYCFLQNYLTDGRSKTVEDIDMLMREIKDNISRQPGRLFRIGTWELGDSLALETSIGQAANLIREFSMLNNAVLELKTKSDCVDTLLKLDHGHRTIISWSLNTPAVRKADEKGTASIEQRINAISKAAKAGYMIGLHFDPMILHDDWEQGYAYLVKNIFSVLDSASIAWISIGSLRFNPEMKKKIENNYPDSRLTAAEMVLGDDSKVRYVKPMRIKMYTDLMSELNKFITPDVLVYLCMERWDVWEKVLKFRPESSSHLDYLFAESLYSRFAIGDTPPDRKRYEEADIPA
ncbi:radical SAM protein [bacterium]|nr:radical SAM protein [bacterium]